MSSPTNHPRPRRSLYYTVTTQWLTPTNFAWFLAAALVIVLSVLAVNSARVLGLGENRYPHTLVAMNGTALDAALRNANTLGTVVFLYDSQCTGCDRQIVSLLNLRSAEEEGFVSLYFLSMDNTPEETLAFLQDQHVPESMKTYYVSPGMRVNITTILSHRGSMALDSRFPHTLLFNNTGQLIVEYKGYVRAQEILRTLNLYRSSRR